jgi:hypothetical protein
VRGGRGGRGRTDAVEEDKTGLTSVAGGLVTGGDGCWRRGGDDGISRGRWCCM